MIWKKGYDTTWRYGILKDIHKLGLRGRLPTFIENFLADRAMQVRVSSSFSDYYDQEQGVPQGGVLSTTLFSVKINDIVQRERSGSVVECLTRDQRAAGSSLTGVTALWLLSKTHLS